ncbi:MAG: HPr family phosphocarrier protein, partial [Bacteroidota bacterium]
NSLMIITKCYFLRPEFRRTPNGEVMIKLHQASVPEEKEITLTVPNALGLHARPAVKLVGLLGRYSAQVDVRKTGGFAVNAKSISEVSTLGARQGDALTFVIKGEAADEIANKLGTFAAANFGDPEMPETVDSSSTEPSVADITEEEGLITGIAAAPGIYVAEAKKVRCLSPPLNDRKADDPQAEVTKLKNALKKVSAAYTVMQKNARLQPGEKEILAFCQLLLADQELIKKTERAIISTGNQAPLMWWFATQRLEKKYLVSESTYMRERAEDIHEISRRVIFTLLGVPDRDLSLKEPGILVLEDIGPAEVMELNPAFVKGSLPGAGLPRMPPSLLVLGVFPPSWVWERPFTGLRTEPRLPWTVSMARFGW